MKDKILAAGTNYGVTIEDATSDYPWFRLWASSERSDDDTAHIWYFDPDGTNLGDYDRDNTRPQVVCVAKQ